MDGLERGKERRSSDEYVRKRGEREEEEN